ncbi:MAG TPA: class I SAM-dependent methyltransferase [Candidatus Paceibacterota bacterium]
MHAEASRITSCRICGNKNLVSLLNLGDQALTGVFPKNKDEVITFGPLELVKCQEDKNNSTCGLVQLAHTYPKEEMYNNHYGYRSGLNKLMLDHLGDKAEKIKKIIELNPGDIVVDIGSNDSSFLKNFDSSLTLVGIDPTGFKEYYPDHISLLPHFFNADLIKKDFADKKVKLVTSIAMFYDLDRPLDFVKDIYDILAPDGVWVTEQSYLPAMLEANSFDTICHEHLEYYCLKQIKWVADKVGLKIVGVEFNDINGGSFSVMMAKKNSSLKEDIKLSEEILNKEYENEMSTNKPVQDLNDRLAKMKDDLLVFLKGVKSKGKMIMGYGASTKGNVLLQFCGITSDLLPFIGEVNPSKFGSFTPGTFISIIDEKEVKRMKPDYLLVLPWHFRKIILEKEKEYMKGGGVLVFPLPTLELVGGDTIQKIF